MSSGWNVSHNGAGISGNSYGKTMNAHHYLSVYTKINWKLFICLDIKYINIKLQGENIGYYLCYLG